MVVGDDMNYINPAAGKRYDKQPERKLQLKQDVVVPAGTWFHRAPLERGGVDRIEAVVALGADACAYLNLPLRVAEVDAPEWFLEVRDEGMPMAPEIHSHPEEEV